MLYYLSQFENVWGPLRLFRYITFRAALTLIFSLGISFYLFPKLIRWIRRLKWHQVLRDRDTVRELASLHSGKKETPTMGGLGIFLGIGVSIFLFARWNIYVVSTFFIYAAFTLLGFYDDFRKLKQKNNAGVPANVKVFAQAIFIFITLGLLLKNPETHIKVSQLWVPFFKYPVFECMPLWFLYLFLFFIISGTSNALNLTDGADGLAIGCLMPVALAYAVMAYVAGNSIMSNYLFLSFIPGTEELVLFCFALVGSGLAFLWYNAHPAEIFMGDVGSLGIGALMGMIAFLVHQPFVLVLVGGIFVIETLSVILQVGSFKLRKGKRIFKMAPLHHHFELKNWGETKVVVRFWILSLLFSLLGLLTLKLR